MHESIYNTLLALPRENFDIHADLWFFRHQPIWKYNQTNEICIWQERLCYELLFWKIGEITPVSWPYHNTITSRQEMGLHTRTKYFANTLDMWNSIQSISRKINVVFLSIKKAYSDICFNLNYSSVTQISHIICVSEYLITRYIKSQCLFLGISGCKVLDARLLGRSHFINENWVKRLRMELANILFEIVSPTMAGLIIIVNLAEIVMLTRKKRGKGLTAPMVYVLSLSISDLCVGKVIVCVKIVHFLEKTGTIRNKEDARAAQYLMKYMFLRISLLMSLANLVALTVDRMVSLRTLVKRSKKTAIIISIINTLSSIVFILVLYFTLHSFISKDDYLQYELLMFSVLVFPSAVYFAIAYTLIIRYAKQLQRRLVGSLRCTKLSEPSITSDANVDDAFKQQTYLKREKKLTKLMSSIVLGFLVCWAPLAVHGILYAADVKINLGASYTCYVLAFSNSLLNPIIYFFHMRRRVRRSFRRMFQTFTSTWKSLKLVMQPKNDKSSFVFHHTIVDGRVWISC